MIKFNTAYRKAQHGKFNARVAAKTDAAPQIFWLRKDGSRGQQLLQWHHHWTTVEEAKKTIAYIEGINPGRRLAVVA